ncbi:MAG TPA: hypothetical protein VFZ66_00735 [Herpetosiphonaceae bacterium]
MNEGQTAQDDSFDDEPEELIPEPELQPAHGNTREDQYFQLLVVALRACAQYKPMFGKGRKGGLSLEQFQEMYRADSFYSWVGLDSPLMYAAHKAAGGMTSIYRQLGIGGEWIFRNVLRDSLGLSAEQATWSYEVPIAQGKLRKLTLDGRIQFDHVRNPMIRARVQEWVAAAADQLRLNHKMREQIKGVVFEVRQGYKSKDSKRQNADIANASNAYTNFYMPVLVLLSTQIDQDVALRYRQAQWLLLTGTTHGSTVSSTYAFCREVLGYDLARFYQSYTSQIKAELETVLKTLLEV